MDEKTYVDGFHDPEKVGNITYNDLGKTGLRVSSISIGGSTFGNVYGEMAEKVCIDTIHEVLKMGLNYIDTAPWYGPRRSEEMIGKALKGIPRKSYYLATKVGRYERDVNKMFDFSAKTVYEGFNKSLELLGVDYVDIIQAHDIEFAEDINQVINETLPTLQKIVDEGRARYIGITGYCLKTLKHVLDNSSVKISTVLGFAQNTMLDKTLVDYIPHFQKAGVGIINASVTSMGLLSSGGVQSWHPAGNDLRQAGVKASQLALSRGVELAHLAIQCSVHTPGVSTNLLGCMTKEQFLESVTVARSPPTELHIQLTKDIEDQIFSKLARREWGNDHVLQYCEEKKKLGKQENN